MYTAAVLSFVATCTPTCENTLRNFPQNSFITYSLQTVSTSVLTSVGNAERKLCVCEAVEMCCVGPGTVVFFSS